MKASALKFRTSMSFSGFIIYETVFANKAQAVTLKG